MNTIKCTAGILLLSMIFCKDLNAQNKSVEDELKTALATDSLFWQHYNSCNIDAMRAFFTDDIEFYHDKGGVITGLDKFLSTSKRNLCGDDNFRLRREVVAGSVKIFPMKDGEILYGAILSGQHVFYVLENGKEPRLDGLARFTHLMLRTESGWKMSRVLSYDHGPAPYVNHRTGVVVSETILQRYVGKYKAPHSGICEIKRIDGVLTLTIGDKIFKLLAESDTLFFSADRDLTFEFKEDRMIVREQGKVVEEASRIK
jgi:hypothetical protein